MYESNSHQKIIEETNRFFQHYIRINFRFYRLVIYFARKKTQFLLVIRSPKCAEIWKTFRLLEEMNERNRDPKIYWEWLSIAENASNSGKLIQISIGKSVWEVYNAKRWSFRARDPKALQAIELEPRRGCQPMQMRVKMVTDSVPLFAIDAKLPSDYGLVYFARLVLSRVLSMDSWSVWRARYSIYITLEFPPIQMRMFFN